MPTWLCGVRFWPESATRGSALYSPVAGWQRAAGCFDAVRLVDAPSVEAAASATLAFAVPAPETAVAAGFPALPRGVGASLWFGAGGWLLAGLPDQMAWLTLAMAFLRRRIYQRATFETAWHSAAVNELAALVFATHRAEDAVGTCRTYGVPAVLVPGWVVPDDVPESDDHRAARAATIVQYGGVVAVDDDVRERARGAGLTEALRTVLAPSFHADVAIETVR